MVDRNPEDVRVQRSSYLDKDTLSPLLLKESIWALSQRKVNSSHSHSRRQIESSCGPRLRAIPIHLAK